MKQRIQRLLLALGLVAPMLAAAPVRAATTTVSPADMNGWIIYQELATASGQLVNGPSAPPLGSGSVEMTVDSTGRAIAANNDFAGTELSSITELKYSTYRHSGHTNPAATISLQLDFDGNLSDAVTDWQGRLVYEPYFTHAVNDDVWQTWDTQDNAAGGNWWGSPNALSTLDEVCPQSNPCTWSEVMTAFPDGGVRVNNGTDTAGYVNLKLGGPITGGMVANADALTMTVNGTQTVFNFELVDPVVLSAPTNLRWMDGANVVPCDGTTSATLIAPTWDAVDGAVSYNYEYMRPGSAVWENGGNYTDTTTGNTAFGSPEGDEGVWQFRVNAVDENGMVSEWSSACAVTFQRAVGPEMPTNKDQCKKDGWKTFGVFKNQGDCVSYVATGGRNKPANSAALRF